MVRGEQKILCFVFKVSLVIREKNGFWMFICKILLDNLNFNFLKFRLKIKQVFSKYDYFFKVDLDYNFNVF